MSKGAGGKCFMSDDSFYRKYSFVFSLSILVVSIAFAGCITMDNLRSETGDEYASGKFDSELLTTVAADTGCAIEQIRIIEREDTAGQGDYSVEACGRIRNYRRTGSVYFSAAHALSAP